MARACVPHLRAAGGGRFLQLSSVAGQIAHAGASLYHATKWGIEGFAEALAQEVEGFGTGVTLVEPGGARTRFGGSSLQWGTRLSVYDSTPLPRIRAMLQDPGYEALGDPVRMAEAMISSLERTPAPLRLVLGSDAHTGIVQALGRRLTDVRAQQESAMATDFSLDVESVSGGDLDQAG